MTLSSAIATKQTFELVCQSIETETRDVKTFIFSVPKSQAPLTFRFNAGQHLNFTVNMAGIIQPCCYTLSSSPTTTDYISITVKRLPQGRVSNYFHDHFQVGQSISALKVAGNFHLPDVIPEKILLISAGSGITPMLSMLRFMVAKQCENEVLFIHSAKSESDLIAKAELENLARQHGNCQIIYTLTQKANLRWYGFQGRLNEHMLDNIEQLSHYNAFVCGPKSFRKTVQKLLQNLGLPASNYHFESFGEHEYSKESMSSIKQGNQTLRPLNTSINTAISTPTNTPKKEPSITMPNNKTNVSIHFSRWNKSYPGNQSMSLLEQGESAGLILPYSCRAGCCGRCKAKLISGQVQQYSTNGLSTREQKQGYILLCSCKPLSDVEISHE
ncbi:2Fe-2S iron-sulfur cluster-binding protein [Colwellia piezophila]|uniref:2Fe-2S iron-sulfur cluster-binding protein n=1 Tax=Colwellia piezophila TaxID=211668 RepID=UPI0003730E5F|nr:2Fe-2S iron-sulfur cluster-binding protein [Colwellia piezophila]